MTCMHTGGKSEHESMEQHQQVEHISKISSFCPPPERQRELLKKHSLNVHSTDSRREPSVVFLVSVHYQALNLI